jgi:hypothetical protein
VKLAGWERAISGSDPVERLRVLSDIRSISDPHAILAIEETTLDAVGNDKRKLDQSRTIGMAFIEALSAIDDRASTNSLTRHAVFAPTEEVRFAAIDALKERSLFAYVPPLMDALAMPIESSYSIQVYQNGSVYYHHELFREGKLSNEAFDRHLTFRQVDRRVIRRGDLRRESDALIGERKARVADGGKSRFASAAFVAERQVAHANHATSMFNSRIAAVLERTTGQGFGTDPRTWWDWWQRYNE